MICKLKIDGFSRSVAEKIEPFIYFGEEDRIPGHSSGFLKNGKHELFLRTMTLIQDQAGFLPRSDGTIPFEGNKYRYYSRYKFTAGENISAGFTAE